MSLRDHRAYLWDMAEACRHVLAFTHGKSLEDYRHDILLRSAVERQLMIVGEALNQAIRMIPELEPRIGDSRQIIALRNRLVHGYATLAHNIVWDIIVGDIANLRARSSDCSWPSPTPSGKPLPLGVCHPNSGSRSFRDRRAGGTSISPIQPALTDNA